MRSLAKLRHDNWMLAEANRLFIFNKRFGSHCRRRHNFDPTLNSSHASYFYNPDNTEAYGENRWKTGGGIDTGVW